MKKPTHLLFATVLYFATHTQAATVYANNTTTGDNFTTPGSRIGMPIGNSGWFYNNTGGDGSVGIDSTYARSGDGSLRFTTSSGASKCDVEFLSGATLVNGTYVATTSLGKLANLSSLSYDWYRDSITAHTSYVHPSLRLYIDMDGNLGTYSDRGYLVFERAQNGMVSPVPTNLWVTDDVFNFRGTNLGANLWPTGGIATTLGISNNQDRYQILLNEWTIAIDNKLGALSTANAEILGISSGSGSGWNGTTTMAVDNITLGFNGIPTVYNFEVSPVPEAQVGMMVFLTAGIFLRRKR